MLVPMKIFPYFLSISSIFHAWVAYIAIKAINDLSTEIVSKKFPTFRAMKKRARMLYAIVLSVQSNIRALVNLPAETFAIHRLLFRL